MGILRLMARLQDLLQLHQLISLIILVGLSFSINLLFLRSTFLRPKYPNMLIAFLLTLFNPGSGQMYKKHRKKGIAFGSLFIGLVTGAVISGVDRLVDVILLLIIVSSIDALFIGKGNRRRSATSTAGYSDDKKGYDVLDQVMDDMNQQFNDHSSSYSNHTNW